MRFVSLAFVACFLLASGACTSDAETGRDSRTWSKHVEIAIPSGQLGYTLSVRKTPSDDCLLVSVAVDNKHASPVFFLVPPDFQGDGEISGLRRDGVLAVSMGWPFDRESGLLKLELLADGEPLAFSYRVRCPEGCQDIRAVQVSVFFILSRIDFFRNEFAKLHDNGFEWHTEVGSRIWCDYFESLVEDIVTVPMVEEVDLCGRKGSDVG